MHFTMFASNNGNKVPAEPFTVVFKQTMTENKASCQEHTILSLCEADVQSRTLNMDTMGLLAVVYTIYHY